MRVIPAIRPPPSGICPHWLGQSFPKRAHLLQINLMLQLVSYCAISAVFAKNKTTAVSYAEAVAIIALILTGLKHL